MNTAENQVKQLELRDFRIRYGNDWIAIKIKFSGHQTFILTYPRELEINAAQYADGFFGHIYRAEYWWYMQRVSKPSHEGIRIMYKRAKIAAALTNKMLKQLAEAGE